MGTLSKTRFVNKLFDAFRKGDVNYIASYLSGDVELAFQNAQNPHSTFLKRPSLVLSFFKKMLKTVAISDFEVHSSFENGNLIAVLGRIAGKDIYSGKQFDNPLVMSIELDKDGNIRRFQDFVDTQKLFYA